MLQKKFQAGYTLIEIMVVIGIFAVLSGLIGINFVRPQAQANVSSIADGVFSDLKNQQTRAMVGEATGQSASQAYGIHIEGPTYTLFQGTTYSAGNSSNVVVRLNNVTASTNFSGGQVVFSRMSGEVANFSAGANTITLSSGTEQKVISVNRYGVITIQ